MKNLKNKYARALLAAPIMALLVTPMEAQTINESTSRVSFKIGMAPALNPDSQQRRASQMVALEYSHPIWKGEFFVVGEWREFIANPHEATLFSPFGWGEAGTDGSQITLGERTGYAPVSTNASGWGGYNPDGKMGYITAFVRNPTSTPRPYMIASDMRFDSVDMRKYQLDGVTAKLAYRYRTGSLPFVGSFGIQGGLTLSFLRSWEYADGAIHVLDYRDMTQNNRSTATYPEATTNGLDQIGGRLFNEYFMEQESRTKLKPGAFIGIRKLFHDDYFMEVNLTMLGHTEVKYVPFAYSGKDPHFVESNKTKTVIEIIAGMRF